MNNLFHWSLMKGDIFLGVLFLNVNFPGGVNPAFKTLWYIIDFKAFSLWPGVPSILLTRKPCVLSDTLNVAWAFSVNSPFLHVMCFWICLHCLTTNFTFKCLMDLNVIQKFLLPNTDDITNVAIDFCIIVNIQFSQIWKSFTTILAYTAHFRAK